MEKHYIYQPNEMGYEIVSETCKNIRIHQYGAKKSHFKLATEKNLANAKGKELK